MKNQIFAVNLSAPYIAKEKHQELKTLLLHADYIFGNSNEAKAFADIENWDEVRLIVE